MDAASRAKEVLATPDNRGFDVVRRITGFRAELGSGAVYLHDFLSG